MSKQQITERGPWKANESEGKTFIESADFTHDVRLYINGDFSDSEQRNQYAVEIARRLNAAPSASQWVRISPETMPIVNSIVALRKDGRVYDTLAIYHGNGRWQFLSEKHAWANHQATEYMLIQPPKE